MILSVTDQISELRLLQPNWDSYGGNPPTQEALDAALGLATTLASAVQLVPCPSGAIQLEWHLGDWDIQMYIGKDGVVELLESSLEQRRPPKSVYEQEGK